MKKAILTLVLAFAVTAGYSQLTSFLSKEIPIGKVKRMGKEFIWLIQSITSEDTSYVLRFRNGAYRELVDIQSISFKGSQTVNDLYAALGSAFQKNENEQTTIVLGKTTVLVKCAKHMGKKYITAYADVGQTVDFTEKELKNLFGRTN